MIFEVLHIENFRQFYGKQELSFAHDTNEQKVTVIHGFNGSGKTTLLNAFTWLLYKDFTPDFDGAEVLENEAAFTELEPEGQLRVSLKLHFSDHGTKYIVERHQIIYKNEEGQREPEDSELSLHYLSETGELVKYENPQETIHKLLPEALHPFFFFNGERIERLAKPEAYEEVAEGLRVLLEIELFDRTISHLSKGVLKQFQNDLAEDAGSEGEVQIKRRDRKHKELEKLKEESSQIRDNINFIEEQISVTGSKLEGIQAVAELASERKTEEQALRSYNSEKLQLKEAISNQISQFGYLAFSSQVLKKSDSILSQAFKRGNIPADIKEHFVESLLEKEQCICLRPLKKGSLEYDSVEQWRSRSKLSHLEGEATTLGHAIPRLQNEQEDFFNELDRLQQRKDQLISLCNAAEERISEINNEIGSDAQEESIVKLNQVSLGNL